MFCDLSRCVCVCVSTRCRFIKEIETANIELLAADEKLAALWQDCKAAKDEFPEQPSHVRRAIALGRLQLDPLPILAALCGTRAEVGVYSVPLEVHLCVYVCMCVSTGIREYGRAQYSTTLSARRQCAMPVYERSCYRVKEKHVVCVCVSCVVYHIGVVPVPVRHAALSRGRSEDACH